MLLSTLHVFYSILEDIEVFSLSRGSLLDSLLGQSTQLLSSGTQAPRVSTLDHGLAVNSNLLAVLEEQECGHGSDAISSSDVLDVVNVDLSEGEVILGSVLVGKALVDGGDGLARGTPVGVEVEGDVSV